VLRLALCHQAIISTGCQPDIVHLCKEINTAAVKNIFKEALNFEPMEKFEIIDKRLSTLGTPDREIDKLWSQEAEDRITAFEKGAIKMLTIKEVLEKYT
jgi:hypothetical protein